MKMLIHTSSNLHKHQENLDGKSSTPLWFTQKALCEKHLQSNEHVGLALIST